MTSGGYLVGRFVPVPSEDLMCGICFEEVLNDPHQCRNGHCYCLSCIKRALIVNKSCPTCKVELTPRTLSANLLIKRMIGKLHVKCEKLCGWTGPLDNTEAHKSTVCSMEIASCPLFSENKCQCTGKMTRGELVEHLALFEKFKTFVTHIENFKNLQVTGWETIVSDAGIFKGRHLTDMQGLGVMKWTDGTFYSGEWVEGEPNGIGVLKSGNYRLYYGSVYNGLKHGDGVLACGVAVHYCGQFVNDLFEGRGRLKDADGSVFVGPFQRGLKHGAGTLTLNGDVHEGQWVDGAPSGQLKVQCANGDRFVGCFNKNCLRDGYGVLTRKKHGRTSVVIYEGEWKAGVRCGMGTTHEQPGTEYVGYWLDGLQHGEGTSTNTNLGQTYVGAWDKGKRQGRGKLTEGRGVYEGQFEHDLFHGVGNFTNKNGDVYDGSWVNGIRTGLCTLWFANGDIYKGQFFDGKLTGQGKMSYADNGKHFSGIWRDSKFIGPGELEYANGDKFRGSFNEMIPVRFGLYISTDGWEYTGELTQEDSGMHRTGFGSCKDLNAWECVFWSVE